MNQRIYLAYSRKMTNENVCPQCAGRGRLNGKICPGCGGLGKLIETSGRSPI